MGKISFSTLITLSLAIWPVLAHGMWAEMAVCNSKPKSKGHHKFLLLPFHHKDVSQTATWPGKWRNMWSVPEYKPGTRIAKSSRARQSQDPWVGKQMNTGNWKSVFVDAPSWRVIATKLTNTEDYDTSNPWSYPHPSFSPLSLFQFISWLSQQPFISCLSCARHWSKCCGYRNLKALPG